MSEYYAYDSEEEEMLQLEYEKECMKNYPLTWELDRTPGVRVRTHGESCPPGVRVRTHGKSCPPPDKSKKAQSITNVWAHLKQKTIKCD